MVDTRISLRGSQTDKIRGSDLNLFVTTFFWRGAPLIGDDYARATLGTQLRWDILALFHQVKSNFGRNPATKTVWPGIEGSHDDQAINGVLYLLQPEIASAYMDELPIDEVDLQRLGVILRRWEKYAGELLSLRERGNPIEVPPAPVEAPAKPETPPVVVPDWWLCPKCDDNNPPLAERCMKCRTPRPGATPVDAPKPTDPVLTGQWKKTLLSIAAILTSAGIVLKIFGSGWISVILDAAATILKTIAGSFL